MNSIKHGVVENIPKAIGYLSRCPASYSTHNSDCCNEATSKLSVVAVILGLIEDTSEANSVNREHMTGFPAT